MKQDHRQFSDTTFKELPAPLPVGEHVIWQGKPSFDGSGAARLPYQGSRCLFRAAPVWRLWSNWSHAMPAGEAVISVMWLIVPAISAVAVLAGLAWLFRRAACYTVTSKRVLFQFGVALPMTINIPLGKIAGAALKTYRDGSGDIPLKLSDGERVSYLLLWPHIRPWRLRAPEPMLNAIPDAARVAAKLAEALTGQPAPSAIAQAAYGNAGAASIANTSPNSAAA